MWIVNGAKGEQITLVSAKDSDEILPIGSYLTVKGSDRIKHILRVEKSEQVSLFEPSPLIVDAGLPLMQQDQECRNVITATRIRQYPVPASGKFSFVKPQDKAFRSTQEEINEVFKSENGFPVFLATHFLSQDAPLKDDSNALISVRIPFDSLYLQTMICGQTGSGKTVAMKYLIEQFLEHEKGAVLAINVKGADLLTMDQPTTFEEKPSLKENSEQEWVTLGLTQPEMKQFVIFSPASNERIKEGVNKDRIVLITLKAADLEPNSLLAILETGSSVTERAAESLPGIFRAWKEDSRRGELKTFREFINFFKMHATKEQEFTFPVISQSGEESEVQLHQGTCRAIMQTLESVSTFFDSKENKAWPISENNILVPGKLSVIDLSSKNTTIFGAVLLRHLLSRIYDAKTNRTEEFSDVPVLIIIDEVHNFYRSSASKQALEELNAIARMGRSSKIGVIFASQTPEDLPSGLTSIVNTRIFFRSLGTTGRKFDVKNLSVELSSLSNGYAAMSSVAIPQVRFVKFPISRMGVKS